MDSLLSIIGYVTGAVAVYLALLGVVLHALVAWKLLAEVLYKVIGAGRRVPAGKARGDSGWRSHVA